MSQWHEPKTDDIEIDKIRHEVEIFVMNDENGNVYITLTFSQIKALYNKIETIENATKKEP